MNLLDIRKRLLCLLAFDTCPAKFMDGQKDVEVGYKFLVSGVLYVCYDDLIKQLLSLNFR
jgi:hypothetical protein